MRIDQLEHALRVIEEADKSAPRVIAFILRSGNDITGRCDDVNHMAETITVWRDTVPPKPSVIAIGQIAAVERV